MEVHREYQYPNVNLFRAWEDVGHIHPPRIQILFFFCWVLSLKIEEISVDVIYTPIFPLFLENGFFVNSVLGPVLNERPG